MAAKTRTISYVPAPGSRISKKKAEVYGRVLERLSTKGPLTVQKVLDEAARPGSQIHDFFEWDDTIAAEEYRKVQARTLMRSVSIVVETRNGPELSRAFHCITNGAGEDRAQWFDSATVFSDADLRGRVILEALSELNGWKSRYQQYSELSGILKEIQIVEREIRSRKVKVG